MTSKAESEEATRLPPGSPGTPTCETLPLKDHHHPSFEAEAQPDEQSWEVLHPQAEPRPGAKRGREDAPSEDPSVLDDSTLLGLLN